MLRVMIVLPIYLAAMYFAPSLPGYAQFEALVRATETTTTRHIIDYAVALAMALLLAWMIDRQTLSPRYGAFFRVIRMGLLGVVVAALYQLFCLLTATGMSIMILLAPPIFMIAEAAYETVEAALGALRGNRSVEP